MAFSRAKTFARPKKTPALQATVNMENRLSGNIAIVAPRKTAEMSSNEFSLSSETILRDSYMDDISKSVTTRDEALILTFEIDNILERGGFRIKGWTISGEG